jgi:hypothetical protein
MNKPVARRRSEVAWFAGVGISGVVGGQLGGASPEKKSGGWPVWVTGCRPGVS